MKNDIHPDYHFITVKLADGTTYRTRSTMKGDTFNSEVDSTNHPFYTGKKTMVDTTGRVEKFRRRYGKKAESSDEGESNEGESNEENA
jgi:large subunit ribosomal protein L31